MDSGSYTSSSRFLQWGIYVGVRKGRRPSPCVKQYVLQEEARLCVCVCVCVCVCERERERKKELAFNEHLLCALHHIRYFPSLISSTHKHLSKVGIMMNSLREVRERAWGHTF